MGGREPRGLGGGAEGHLCCGGSEVFLAVMGDAKGRAVAAAGTGKGQTAARKDMGEDSRNSCRSAPASRLLPKGTIAFGYPGVASVKVQNAWPSAKK